MATVSARRSAWTAAVLLFGGACAGLRGPAPAGTDGAERPAALAPAPSSTAPAADALARARELLTAGISFRGQTRWGEAQQNLEQALALAESAGERALAANCHLELGHVFMLQGLWDPAEAQYQAALAFYGAEPPSVGLVAATEGLGDVADGRGDTARALSLFERGAELARRLGDPNLLAKALTSLGGVSIDRADYPKAHALLLEALDAHPEPRRVARIQNDLGLVAALQGERDLAEDYYRRARATALELGDHYGAARTLNNLAVLWLEKKDYAAARQAFETVLAESEKAGDREAVTGHWRNLGIVLQAEGRLADARAAYEKSVALARELGQKEEIAEGLETLGELALAQGAPADTLKLEDEAAALAVALDRPELFWRCRTLTGQALTKLGRDAEARAALEDAILAIEAVRRALPGSAEQEFFAGRLLPYQSLLELEVRAGRVRQALEVAEAARARRLLDRLRQGGAAVDAVPAEDQAREDLLRRQLARHNQELFQARQQEGSTPDALAALKAAVERSRLDLEAFGADLLARRPELAPVTRAFPDLRSANRAAPALDGGTLVLAFAVLGERTYLFTLAPQGAAASSPHVVEIAAGQESLARSVDDFRGRIARRDPGFGELSRQLHDLLLAPVARELRTARRLVIVPDGPLWDLPFQALVDDNGTFLEERHPLAYAPSLAVLDELRHRAGPPAANPGAVLAIGNPAFAPSPEPLAQGPHRRDRALSPLPEAESEVRALARLYGPAAVQLLIGADATESQVKRRAGSFGVLHFATHGILESDGPLYSYLVLAQSPPAEGEDGLLEAWEVLGLQLQAELVVLSACQTAQGQLDEGEGLIGLTWAFLAAGSRAVVASQWEVDSEATRALMIELHRRLKAGEPKDRALQGAARALAARPAYRHPFYWAGFVLVGDGGGGPRIASRGLG